MMYFRSSHWLSLYFRGLLGICGFALLGCLMVPSPVWAAEGEGPGLATHSLTKLNTDLVDDISRRSFRYFWEQTDPRTGLAPDRALNDGEDQEKQGPGRVASIAATGFGLTAYCIAADHRWISHETARQRVLTTLRFLADAAPNQHGWFYHYMDSATGKRAWSSEISSIDTALLLAGVLTTRQYFRDDFEINKLATLIYSRVDFRWMMDGSLLYFSHGWTPERGFISYRWDTYSELLILYTLGIGSPTHPISPDTWDMWKLPMVGVEGHMYVGGGPLFIHQFSQAWLDLRDRFPAVPQPTDSIVLPSDSSSSSYRVNYLANSIAATRAQQELFSKDLSRQFPGYSSKVWGVTASDSAKGYTDWGTSPTDSRIDGTVVPSAAAGSLMFTPDICIPAMRAMLVKYGKKIYGRYGFTDAFNPNTGWTSPYVIGIDVGITLLSAENLRTGNVWQWFMTNPEPEYALDLVGLKRLHPAPDRDSTPPQQPSQTVVNLSSGLPNK
jgi:hypothetical protein